MSSLLVKVLDIKDFCWFSAHHTNTVSSMPFWVKIWLHFFIKVIFISLVCYKGMNYTNILKLNFKSPLCIILIPSFHLSFTQWILVKIFQLFKFEVSIFGKSVGILGSRFTRARFTNIKTLLSLSSIGNFPMKNCARRENCDSRAWWILTLISIWHLKIKNKCGYKLNRCWPPALPSELSNLGYIHLYTQCHNSRYP